MKKFLLIIISLVVVIAIVGAVWFNASLKSVSKESEKVSFVIETGTSVKKIVANLKEANLIKSESATLIYVKLNTDLNFKAGSYELNRDMSVKDIFDALSAGGKDNTVRITFKEGVTLEKFVNQIAEATEQDYESLIAEINSKEFLEPLIEKYWFLTDDILKEGIYYPLEGYLYPNTYEIYKDASLASVVKKMLDETYNILDAYKIAINESKYNTHEVLTMASIIEKEAVNSEDRAKVSQVIYKRLNTGMSLGMDVTSYYGARKDMTEAITSAELYDDNPYNTRFKSKKGLPIGPICNPSKSSIKAALNPANTNYIYFIADISTGIVYFTDSYSEFQTFKSIYG